MSCRHCIGEAIITSNPGGKETSEHMHMRTRLVRSMTAQTISYRLLVIRPEKHFGIMLTLKTAVLTKYCHAQGETEYRTET